MRVLFLSNEHGVDRSRSAYSHRLEKLSSALQHRGVQTDFLYLREQPLSKPLLIHPLNLPFIYRKVVGFDFIHAGGDAAYTASFLKPYIKARIIYDVHGDTLSEAQLKWTVSKGLKTAHMLMQARILNAVTYRHFDYFLTVSKPLQQRLINEKHIPAHKIELIRNGVDLDLFNQTTGHSSKNFVVGYAGGFQRWQGIDNLVNAVEMITENQIQLKIIGFNKNNTDIKHSIEERLGTRAELVDRVTQSELVTHLKAAHILVIPRFTHRAVEVALPTKFAEYLALGKPIIVSDVDETATLVRQHQCGLVSKPNPTALAETIQAASNLDPAELKQMGENARRLAEQEFSWDNIGQEYSDLITEWSSRDR